MDCCYLLYQVMFHPVKEEPGYIVEKVAELAINEFLDATCKSSLLDFLLIITDTMRS